jgi:hypothetical protein
VIIGFKVPAKHWLLRFTVLVLKGVGNISTFNFILIQG